MQDKLVNILNMLKLVQTRGDDTIIMSQCLLTLKQVIEDQKIEDAEASN